LPHTGCPTNCSLTRLVSPPGFLRSCGNFKPTDKCVKRHVHICSASILSTAAAGEKTKPNSGKVWPKFCSCCSANVTFSINWPGPGEKKGAGEALIPKPLPGCAGRQNDWATAAVLDLCLCPGTPTPPILLLELLCPGKNESCKMPMVSRNAHNFEKFTCWADRRKDTYLPSTKRIRGGGGRPPGHR